MTVDVHPEALLDREARGELTAEERVHLDAHLSVCAACRLERQLRDDFALELGTSVAQGNMQRLVSDALLAARTTPAENEEEAPQVVRPRSWAGRRVAFALAATMLFVSGLAVAQTELAMRVIEAARKAVFVSAPQADVSPAQTRTKKGARRAKSEVSSVAAPVLPLSAQQAQGQLSPSDLNAPPLPETASAEPVRVEPEVQAQPAPVLMAKRRMASPVRPSSNRASNVSPVLETTTARPTLFEGSRSEAASPTPPVQALAPQPANASELFEMAARARRDGRFSEAVLIYRDLIRRFPGSAEGMTSLVVVARLELDRGNSQAALAGYDAYLHTKARSLREQALVGKAQALHKLGRLAEADDSVRALKSEYPDAPYLKLEAERHEADAP